MNSVPNGPMEELKKLGEILMRRTSENEYHRFLELQKECKFKWQTTVDKLALHRKQSEKYASENAELRAELKHISGLWMMENQERRNIERERDYLKMKMRQTYDFLRPNYNPSNGENKADKTYCIDDQSSDEITSTASFLSNLSEVSDVSVPLYEYKPSETLHQSQLSDELNAIFGVKHTKTRQAEKEKENELNVLNKISQQSRNQSIGVGLQVNVQPNQMQTQAMRNNFNDEKRQRLRSPTKQINFMNGSTGDENRQLRNHHPMAVVDPSPIYDSINDDSLLSSYGSSGQAFEKLSGSIAEKPVENLLFFQFETNPDQVTDPHKCQHAFSHRTASRSDICFLCTKKFRFGILAYKCKTCNIFVHHDCKSQMKIAAKTRWSMINSNGYYLSDYVERNKKRNQF